MRKLAILILFLIFSAVNCITVERELQKTIHFNEILEIKIKINPEGIKNFEFTDAIPKEWDFISWNVTINETKVSFSSHQLPYDDRIVYKWIFSNVSEPFELNYYVIPKTIGATKLTMLWKYGNNFSSKESEIFVKAVGPVCGNDICESGYGENNINCPTDCKFKANPYPWLFILLLSTFILILGIAYKLKSKKFYKRKKT